MEEIRKKRCKKETNGEYGERSCLHMEDWPVRSSWYKKDQWT